MTTKAFGNQGEALAEAFLKEKGYEIRAKQYRYKQFEIDLICFDPIAQFLVFVEVKTRTSDSFARPEEAITPSKKRFLVAAAEAYLYLSEQESIHCRFDVITIVFDQGKPAIHHYEDAFWAN